MTGSGRKKRRRGRVARFGNAVAVTVALAIAVAVAPLTGAHGHERPAPVVHVVGP